MPHENKTIVCYIEKPGSAVREDEFLWNAHRYFPEIGAQGELCICKYPHDTTETSHRVTCKVYARGVWVSVCQDYDEHDL